MRLTPSPRALLAAALVLVTARAASAQQAAAPSLVRPVSATAAETRTVAVYRFTRSRVAGLPSEVTVADSAGQLVARYRLAAGGAEQPMLLTFIGDKLVLQSETPQGVLTLLLQEPVDGSRVVTGFWQIEGQRGELRGRTRG